MNRQQMQHLYIWVNEIQPKCLVFVFILSLVGGLCEVCVCSADEAYTLYETCRETLKANAGSIYSRWVKETLTL